MDNKKIIDRKVKKMLDYITDIDINIMYDNFIGSLRYLYTDYGNLSVDSIDNSIKDYFRLSINNSRKDLERIFCELNDGYDTEYISEYNKQELLSEINDYFNLERIAYFWDILEPLKKVSKIRMVEVNDYNDYYNIFIVESKDISLKIDNGLLKWIDTLITEVPINCTVTIDTQEFDTYDLIDDEYSYFEGEVRTKFVNNIVKEVKKIYPILKDMDITEYIDNMVPLELEYS